MSANENCKMKVVFTIPLQCHICLDQVQTPVTCSNKHVFCKRCLKQWLKSHQDCPTCRVRVTEEMVQPLRGSLAPESSVDLPKRIQLLHTRGKVLIKDYQKEFKSLAQNMEQLRKQMECVKSGLASRITMVEDATTDLMSPVSAGDTALPAADVNAAAEEPQAKRRLSMCSQCGSSANVASEARQYVETTRVLESALSESNNESERLAAENFRLTREVRRLEQLVPSPRKMSRYVAAAEESQVRDLQREVNRLKRALERSDAVIEDLERQRSANSGGSRRRSSATTMPACSVTCPANPLTPRSVYVSRPNNSLPPSPTSSYSAAFLGAASASGASAGAASSTLSADTSPDPYRPLTPGHHVVRLNFSKMSEDSLVEAEAEADTGMRNVEGLVVVEPQQQQHIDSQQQSVDGHQQHSFASLDEGGQQGMALLAGSSSASVASDARSDMSLSALSCGDEM